MSPDGPSQRDGTVRILRAARSPQYEDPNAWSSGEVVRLLLVPTIAAVLFVGGVYWVRLQVPAGHTGQDQVSVVQVRLLPRPDPAPIPVTADTQPATTAIATRTDVPREETEARNHDDTAVVPPVTAVTPAQAAVPGIKSAPSPMDAPPSRAMIRFQQALLRHVAAHQRYPGLARPGRLQGSVGTLFSMRRDGTLVGVWVKTSSGQVVLDKEAIDTIRRAQPLPPIPAELPDRLNIEVSLMFDPS